MPIPILPNGLTHYVIYDAPTCDGGRLQLALCERFVDPHHDHSAEPTCPVCQQAIADDEREYASLQAIVDDPTFTRTTPFESAAPDALRQIKDEAEQFETVSHARAARRAGGPR